MYETCSEGKGKSSASQTSKIVTPEYKVIFGNLPAYQRLFRYRYLENVAALSRLCDLVGCRDVEEVVSLERNLDAYFRRVMGGVVRGDLLALVCPSCLRLSLTNYGRDGEAIRKTCSECGIEAPDSVADIDDFSQHLDRDVTFAPESLASYSKGLGGSFDPNKDKDQNNFLWHIMNSGNVLFSEFKQSNPEVAEALDKAFMVEQNGFVFCRVWNERLGKVQVGDFVRKVKVEELFNCLNGFFHAFDAPLKNKKFRLEIRVRSDLKRALEYGLKLCEKYGFDSKGQDQALYNTMGHEIRLMMRQFKSQGHHIPEKSLVETIFYICLLHFDKHGRWVAVKAKSELDIDYALVNYYVDYKEFLQHHDKPNCSKLVLNAIEQASLVKKI